MYSSDEKLKKIFGILIERLPVAGDIVKLIEDINKVYETEPEIKIIVDIEEQLLIHLFAEVMESNRDKYKVFGLSDWSNYLSNIAGRRENIKQDLEEINSLMLPYLRSRIDLKNNEALTKIILSSLFSLIFSNELKPESLRNLRFFLQHLDELDLRILCYVKERAYPWDIFSAEDLKFSNALNDYLTNYSIREIYCSLQKLESVGFLYSHENNYPQEWKAKKYSSLLDDIDKFVESLGLLSFIAIMPSTNYAGIEGEKKAGTLKEWLSSLYLSEPLSRYDLGIIIKTAVRKHPFEGYQYRVQLWQNIGSGKMPMNECEWIGQNWQYETCQEAIEDANKKLVENQQNPEWYYITI